MEIKNLGLDLDLEPWSLNLFFDSLDLIRNTIVNSNIIRVIPYVLLLYMV